MRWLSWIAAALVLAALAWWWLRPQGTAPVPTGPTTAQPVAGGEGSSGLPGVVGEREPRVIERVTPGGARVRLERRPRIDVPSPPYAARVRELQAASDAGDPVARYQLGMVFYQCREVPADEAALERAVEEIHQTRTLRGWDVADPAQEEQALRTSYAHCAGVPPEARGRYRELVRSSAELGLMEAQLNLMFHLPQADYCQFIEDCTPQQAQFMAGLRDEARIYVQRALEGGSVEALRTVGGWALNEEMGTPDEVEAYAYFSAYDQIQQAAGRERELVLMLDGIGKRLRPVDLERAEQRARELLANPKCCVFTR